MARSRKDAWLRDELILALDLYQREGRNPSTAAVDELSGLLRSIPIEQHLASDSRFRNTTGVGMKISNFAALDPTTGTTGMTHGGPGATEVWEEYGSDPEHLSRAAAAIRAHLPTMTPSEAEVEEEEIAEASEGRVLTRVHRVRERSQRLVTRKKREAFAATGILACEVCGFDFAATYGERGAGFIECHHTVPVHALTPGSRTRLGDLALVCSNCHRMIHRASPWLTLDELRALVP